VRHRLSVGLVGLGRWGTNYLDALARTEGCHLTAACDVDPAALSVVGAQQGTRLYRDLETMLTSEDLAAVVIATPEQSHYQLAGSCLQSGLDVLVEKPMTLSAAEAEELVEMAEAEERILAVGHTALYLDDFISTRVSFESGGFRGPVSAEATRASHGPAQPGASDVLWDLVPHDLAMAISLFGNPLRLRLKERASTRVEYEAEFAPGFVLRGRAEWNGTSGPRRLTVKGTGGLLRIDDNGRARSGSERPLDRLCHDFVSSCHHRRAPLSDGRIGLAVVRSLEALETSGQEGNVWHEPARTGLNS